MGTPPSVAMPMVALKRLPLTLASAPWERMPLGKYRRRPRAESMASTSGAAFSKAALSSAASGLMRAVTVFDLGWTARTDKDGWVLARDADDLRVADLYRAFAFDAEAWGITDVDLSLTLRQFASKEKK